MSLRMIATIVAALILAACGSTAYVPTSANMDGRTAQNVVRTSILGAPFIVWNGQETRVNDVRFRNDGMGLLIAGEGGQTMHACYYAGIEGLDVAYLPAGRQGFGGPQYGVGPICNGGRGAVFLGSADEARRLADALFSLKNGAR